MSEEDDDKAFEASQRKLDEARKRGEIARAPDVNVAAAYAGLLLAILVGGATLMQQGGAVGQTLLDGADRASTLFAAGGQAALGPVLSAVGWVILPVFALPMGAVLLALVAQRAVIFTPEKLAPRLSRISPFATAKQKFGPQGLFEFGKSAVKLVAVGLMLALHLWHRSAEIAASLGLPAPASIALMLRLMVEFLSLILLLAAGFGLVDHFWQQAQHRKRNRMSYKEMMDEVKDSEGDPHAKAARRQKGQEIALNRMLQDVAKADVVIVNPTHYAVALRWKRSDRNAPVCVAKGVDEIAARIREKAALAGVPLHSDPPTARAIHAAVEIGEPIRPEHYKPVAAAIRFAEALKKRRKGRS
ncbi:flagellar type III secretion system protein FlhB [Tabrizicola oligotrophica]|uniref:Flagellar biosynthesis protein FlhB n=1 Tax=Tabrizicola oligotrophica TaxID=2710650 RepID=A0A6M0QUH3_9RHOB|nr:flagellar type III secretion system protein FlhB [Tabrizicola oligotrophica]NEY91146.1 flagellar biosynthesis protein FlhB [Tabrizicola oligotrophica]